jgi:hypothetical protein
VTAATNKQETSMETQTMTISQWLRRCRHLQDYPSWSGAYEFLKIKDALKEHTGMTEGGFWNWMERLKKAATAHGHQ